jgi:ubiquitin-like 1-activating enzyme E1 B
MEEVAENGTENGGDSSQHNNQISTRQFAASHKYNPQEIYNKVGTFNLTLISFIQLFVRDIEYLLQMEDLWKDRRPPVPYRIDDLSSIPESSAELPLNTTWSIEKWITEFVLSVQALAERFENESKEGRVLSWDKDDNSALRFVAACANIRAWNFQIPGKSLFDVKSMAGNIIPAIATSNAIGKSSSLIMSNYSLLVAGLMVVETFKIIMGQDDKFKSVCYFCSKQFISF